MKAINKHNTRFWVGLVLLALVLVANSAKAQQESQFSQYMNNNLLINPAVTGIDPFLNLSMGYRNQWNSLNGAMNTYYVTGHSRFSGKEPSHSLPVRGANAQPRYEAVESAGPNSPHGIGGYLFHDNQGVSTQSGIGVSYAYHLVVGGGNLSFGLSGGVIQYALDGNKLEPLDPSDNSILDTRMKTVTGDLSGGAWWSTTSYYVGVAVNQLTQSKISFNGATGAENKQNNHYNISAGYKLPINESITLLPSVLVKYVSPAPVSLDLNAVARFKNMYSIGLSYRNEDAVVILAGFHYKTIQVGYSYDVNTSALSRYNNGSHEVSLAVGLGANAQNGKTLHW